MQLFRRLVVLLALTGTGFAAAFAQSTPSSAPDQSQSPDQSSSSQSGPGQATPDPASPAQQSGGLTPGQLSVQERIRQRREQRRAAAIHEAYGHRWDTFMGLDYLRFKPGPSLQRLTWYAWNVDLTRYSNERLGYTLDARGYFGHAYCGTPGVTTYCEGNSTRPEISMYNVLVGPTYRFYVQPKYSISGRVLAGWALGNFSGDTGGFPPTLLGLYPDGNTFAASASIVGEYNVGPSLSFRLAPEYFFTGFGSTTQASRGFTIGGVYRFGKQ